MSGNHSGKRAVLYARTSYDDRDTDGRNLARQLEMAREYALSKGYRIVAELAEDDKGASGASFELPKLGEVLEMAEAGEFEVLIENRLVAHCFVVHSRCLLPFVCSESQQVAALQDATLTGLFVHDAHAPE